MRMAPTRYMQHLYIDTACFASKYRARPIGRHQVPAIFFSPFAVDGAGWDSTMYTLGYITIRCGARIALLVKAFPDCRTCPRVCVTFRMTVCASGAAELQETRQRVGKRQIQGAPDTKNTRPPVRVDTPVLCQALLHVS